MQITFRGTVIYDTDTTGVNCYPTFGSREALVEEVQMPRANGTLQKDLGTGSATHTLALIYIGTAAELTAIQATLDSLKGATTGALVVPTINGTITKNYCSLQTPVFSGPLTPMARLGQAYKNRMAVTLTFKQTRG